MERIPCPGVRARAARRAAVELLLLGTAAFLFLRSFDAGDLARAALRITPGVLAAAVGFQAVLLGLCTLCWALILRQSGLYRGAWSCFWARTAGFAATYLTPSVSFAGVPTRELLYREDGMDRGKLYATIALDTFLEVAGKVPCIVAGAFCLGCGNRMGAAPVVAAAALPVLLAGGAFLLSCSGRRKGEPSGLILETVLRPLAALRPGAAAAVLSGIRAFREGIRGIVKDRRAVAAAAAAAFAASAVEVAQTWFLLSVLGLGSLPRSLAVYASILVQACTGLLPGNLGGMEGAHVAVFSLLGLAPGSGLVYTAMLRSGQAVAVLCGLLYMACRRLAKARSSRMPVASGARL